jgi:hypothetical protein
MQYRDLLKNLSALTDEQLNQDVTVWQSDTDDYFPGTKLSISDDKNDVLDPGHPYLEVSW